MEIKQMKDASVNAEIVDWLICLREEKIAAGALQLDSNPSRF